MIRAAIDPILGLAVAMLLLAGCNTSIGATLVSTSFPEPSPTPRNSTTKPLPLLTGARTVRIEDDWSGLRTLSPIVAHYYLTRNGSQFTGQATFSVGDNLGKHREATGDMSIPADRVGAFVAALQRVPLSPGPYVPDIQGTDNYPSVSIILDFEKDSVRFFSQSQGVGHVPWAVTTSGTTYVINSAVPQEALALLNPYLEEDVLERLKSEVLTPQPTTSPGKP